MALTGIAFCKPAMTDKKQSMGFHSLNFLSPAAMMHQPKKLDFPFVPLTGHKDVVDPCLTSGFNINDHAKCDTNFSFVKGNNFTNARSLFKNESFRGCHQFPVVSISPLVGGFVGSKSQARSETRESHQVWDVVFRKLDEFVHSKTAEAYADRCYRFQALSQNLIGSLCHESNSAFGLSYILADSFRDCKRPRTYAASSPTSETVPSSEESSVPPSATPPSPLPGVQSTTVPVFLNLVEHLISQPELSKRVQCSRPDSPTPEIPLVSAVALRATPQSPTPESKQTYAEVAKMAHSKLKVEQDRHHRIPKKCSRKARDRRRFGQYSNDSFQRGVDSNEKTCSSGTKDLRRENFHPGLSSIYGSRGCFRRSDHKSDISTHHGQRGKNLEGFKYLKNTPVSYKSGKLMTVPESISNGNKASEQMYQSVSSVKSYNIIDSQESPCPYYNRNKNSCMNWRCRQHVQKSSAKREMKCLLMDNLYEDCYDETAYSDLSPTNLENSDNKANTFETYLEKPLSLTMLTRTRFDGCGPRVPAGSAASFPTEVSIRDGSPLRGPGRSRPLSETVEPPPRPAAKERSSSESSECRRTRSISEESKSTSSSSLSSASSCLPTAESCARRRFSSECDSEDSFVIFDGGETSDSESDSSCGSGDSDSEDEDEVDAACTAFRPFDGGETSRGLDDVLVEGGCRRDAKPRKKVHFAPDERLQTVHLMVAWDFAYRAARCGPWEEIARDRERFRLRVLRCEPILAPVLGASHREGVLRRREAAPCGGQES